MKERERVGKSLALGAAAGRRGGIAAFCGKQVPPNQTSSGKVYLVWIWSQLQSMEELVWLRGYEVVSGMLHFH